MKLGFKSNDPGTGLPPHSACVVVAEGQGATFVTFAGSDPLKFQDWITDFSAMPSPSNLHSGFEQAVETVLPDIRMALGKRAAPNQTVFFTGHSLGGALAILAAWRISRLPNAPEIVVYTFGSPRNGGQEFFNDYTPRLGDFTFRMVHGTDIVPTVPPTLLDDLSSCRTGRAVPDRRTFPRRSAHGAKSEQARSRRKRRTSRLFRRRSFRCASAHSRHYASAQHSKGTARSARQLSISAARLFAITCRTTISAHYPSR